jgi:hypothetical protein
MPCTSWTLKMADEKEPPPTPSDGFPPAEDPRPPVDTDWMTTELVKESGKKNEIERK